MALGMLLVGTHRLGIAAQPHGGTDRATVHKAQAVRNAAEPARRIAHRAISTRPASQPASQPAAIRPAAETRMEMVVYYFHRTLRCPSCLHIETTAQRVVEESFAGEIETGLVRWKAVNIQQRGHEHFAKDYDLSAPSLVLVKRIDGRQVAWKNCDKVWSLHRNELAFAEYVQRELVGMLSMSDVTATCPAGSPHKKGAP